MRVGIRNVRAAARRLRGRIEHTPVFTSRHINQRVGAEVLFKCENLQVSGSFKYRGALNAVLSLPPAVRRQGVVTHSSGNHGAALAAVAERLGIAATVVVPRNASKFKRAAIRRYGARIVDCGASLPARERKLEDVVAESSAHFIPPYDHPAIIAGQGTASLELLHAYPDTEELWLPVGGGGMAAGSVAAVGAQLQVVGAEPALAKDAHDSLAPGQRLPAMPPRTIADGLRTALGALNFRMLHDYQLPIHLVGEDEIVAAQTLAMSCLKVLIEPSSAVPIAALLKAGPQRRSRRIGLIITGGNLALNL